MHFNTMRGVDFNGQQCNSDSSSLGFRVVALGLTSLYWLAKLTCTGLQ